MADFPYRVEMTEEERAELLSDVGHGVLSLAGDDPYGIPMSFAYDEESDRVFVQLVHAEDSEKIDRIEENGRACLTVYEIPEPTIWRSVMLKGELVEVNGDEEKRKAYDDNAIGGPLTVWKEPLTNLDTTWYELEVEEATGRHSERQAA